MSKADVPFEIKNNRMMDNAIKEEHGKLQPRYEIISQIIEARKAQELSQAELAKRIGTQKSNGSVDYDR